MFTFLYPPPLFLSLVEKPMGKGKAIRNREATTPIIPFYFHTMCDIVLLFLRPNKTPLHINHISFIHSFIGW